MNIGCVTYAKNRDSGELRADWRLVKHDSISKGYGIAQGDKGGQFEGIYSISYYLEDDTPTGTFELTIEKKGNSYLLYWFQNSIQTCCGVGMVEHNTLIAGWNNL